MSATGLKTFDRTVHLTNTWLSEINDAMGWGDRQLAYRGLVAVLHALRDRLTVEEGADLAAQLPLLIRGAWYENWTPGREPEGGRGRDAFLAQVGREYDQIPVKPEVLARAVLKVLSAHVAAGEIEDVRRQLPEDHAGLWP